MPAPKKEIASRTVLKGKYLSQVASSPDNQHRHKTYALF